MRIVRVNLYISEICRSSFMAFNLEQWCILMNLNEKSIKVLNLRNEDLTSREVISMLNIDDIKELGLCIWDNVNILRDAVLSLRNDFAPSPALLHLQCLNKNILSVNSSDSHDLSTDDLPTKQLCS